ncbi:hypothetical protein ABIA35_007233 [Catenulispora sp. MAP12-49]|uniref:hypothetical protein n=1 Tax=Catenulispora sp. MAP12-49 TaxID=3156302 RepID=UPI003511D9AA
MTAASRSSWRDRGAAFVQDGRMSALGWDGLVGFLETAVFGGLLFEGSFLDDAAGFRRFCPMSTPVYLESGNGLLKLSTGVNGGTIDFAVVQAPVWEAYGEDWGDMDKVGVLDVGYTYFGEQLEAQCLQVRCAIDNESGPQRGVIRLAEMTFSGGQRVLFDPGWPAGIRVEANKRLEDGLLFDGRLSVDLTFRTWTRLRSESADHPCRPRAVPSSP